MPSSTPAGMLTARVRSRVTRPVPRAGGAGIVDDLAAALAMRAGALDREKALLGAHAAVAGAGGAGSGLGAGLGAGAATGSQATDVGNFEGGRLAVERFFERDFEIVAQIGAALAPCCRGRRGGP